MIPALWPISLSLEAALAVTTTRRGGFPAFVRFLWYDVLTQAAEIALASNGEAYRIVHRSAEVGGIVLLCFAVAEAASKVQTVDGKRQAASLLAIAAIATIPLHLVLASNVRWSLWASAIWQAVALSHSIMATFLAASMFAGRRWSTHAALLSAWLMADAVLFYVAPHFAVGMAVLWLNAGAWAVWIGAKMFQRVRAAT